MAQKFGVMLMHRHQQLMKIIQSQLKSQFRSKIPTNSIFLRLKKGKSQIQWLFKSHRSLKSQPIRSRLQLMSIEKH